jgi:hypothetical protein
MPMKSAESPRERIWVLASSLAAIALAAAAAVASRALLGFPPAVYMVVGAAFMIAVAITRHLVSAVNQTPLPKQPIFFEFLGFCLVTLVVIPHAVIVLAVFDGHEPAYAAIGAAIAAAVIFARSLTVRIRSEGALPAGDSASVGLGGRRGEEPAASPPGRPVARILWKKAIAWTVGGLLLFWLSHIAVFAVLCGALLLWRALS